MVAATRAVHMHRPRVTSHRDAQKLPFARCDFLEEVAHNHAVLCIQQICAYGSMGQTSHPEALCIRMRANQWRGVLCTDEGDEG